MLVRHTHNARLTITSSRIRSLSDQMAPAAATAPPPVRPYNFHIGASWAGKPLGARATNLTSKPFPSTSEVGAFRDRLLARPKAVVSKDAGEDFFYIQTMRENSGVSFGVADGVGGWTENGVDPALFSQSLMYHAHRYAKNAWAGEPEIDPTLDYEEREQVEGWELTPQECLELAHGGVLRERKVEAGSSTACIINLNASSGVLRSANLGDSGFSIIRSSSVVYTQPSQIHFFNCPKQLAKLPTPARTYLGTYVDSPRDAALYETKLRHGDLVIAYTDGLSDNVFASEVLSICALVAKAGGSEDRQVQDMADRIVEYARQCMSNKKRVSPFEKSAAREGLYFRGGKVDDVTVIIAMVRETI